MVGVLLRVDIFLWTEASTAGEIVSVLENIRLDAHKVCRIKRVGLVQFERTKDG